MALYRRLYPRDRPKQTKKATLVPCSFIITMQPSFLHIYYDHDRYNHSSCFSCIPGDETRLNFRNACPQFQPCSTKPPTFPIYSSSPKNYATISTPTQSKQTKSFTNTPKSCRDSGNYVSPTSPPHRNSSTSALSSQQTTNNSASTPSPKPKS